MRKREVIELRYRIDCMGWSSTSKGHQQETVASARLWTHTGVREHGIPDIKTCGIPGRPGWFREKKTVGSIGQCNGEYDRRPLGSRISS